MKKLTHYLMIATIISITSCNKTKNDDTSVPVAAAADNYSSMQDFYNQNGVRMQTFNVNAATGGNFTTPRGTKVTVPANAFVTLSGVPVTGNVTIEFKDVYKKSDMLLSKLTTDTYNGNPLKSAGMFFIKASQNNSVVILATGKKITVEQPFAATTALPDSQMQPFVWRINFPTPGLPITGWVLNNSDTLQMNISYYIYSFYQFSSPLDSGTWGNSDDENYFSGFTKTSLTLKPSDHVDTFQTDVFLVFKNENSMVHVYYNGLSKNFPYTSSPLGLQCTVVAVGVRSGILYSSFNPITITANQSLYFTLSKTTTQEFKEQLTALN